MRKIGVVAAGAGAFVLVLYLWLAFLAKDQCLDRGGALSGPWFSCIDSFGNNWPWFAIIKPVDIVVAMGMLGGVVALVVRFAWRVLDRADKRHA